MSKHKWQVEGTTVYTVDEDGYNRLTTQVQRVRGVPIEEAEAAAKEFAAAPDMLEALEAAIGDHEDLEDGRLSGNTVATIRNAIKKARGQS